MLGYGQPGIISNTNIKPVISEKQKVVSDATTGDLTSEDFPGVGKLLVGPNGPVDATAAAKVAAAGTMPSITISHSPSPVSTTEQPQQLSSITPQALQQNTPKQCVLRCDCCSVTVNSNHQLDLHLNGKYTFEFSVLFTH